MSAKLIVRGGTRAEAVERLAAALGDYQVAGVDTNLPFLRNVARHPAFAAAEIDTGFIERHRDALLQPSPAASERVLALAFVAILLRRAAHSGRAAELGRPTCGDRGGQAV